MKSNILPGRFTVLSVFAALIAVTTIDPIAAQTSRSSGNKLDTVVTLTDGKHFVKKRRRELAIGLADQQAGSTRFRVNRDLLQKTLRNLSHRFGMPPRDARLAARGSSVRVIPAKNGAKLDPAASAVRIADLVEQKPSVRIIRLVMKPVLAKVQAAAFKGIDGRLSQFSTVFNTGNAKRAHNLRLAAQAVDGRLLKPGQVFSLNDAVGERNHDNGYLTAKVFENGKKVPGIGGGVSQVGGTLFNAALLAGLPIVQYQGHSRPVPYLPVGRDATIAWKLYDLRFKNNTKSPIYVACRPSGSRLVASLYGAKQLGKRVAVSVQAKRLGPTHIETALYRTIRQGGSAKRELVGRWEYRWTPDKKPAAVAKR